MEWVIVTGSTVEAATHSALDALSIALEDAEVEVVTVPSSSRWGLRRYPATVRARVRPTGPPPRMGEPRRDRRRSRRSGAKGQSPKRASSGKQGNKRADESGRRPQVRRRGSGTQSTKAGSQHQPRNASTKAPAAASGAEKTTNTGSQTAEQGQAATAARRRRLPGYGDED